MNLPHIAEKIIKNFAHYKINCKFNNELIIEVFETDVLLILLQYLKTDPEISCEQLIDLCGVDYLHYGVIEWETQYATNYGSSKAVQEHKTQDQQANPYRFCVVYNLLSLTHNHRIRVKCFVSESNLKVPSVVAIWPAANWYEREAFDLFGIYFIDHPDLRRILTDYNFHGHPFRKDFPLNGNLEVRFDGKLQKIVYEPVDFEAKVTIPKVIRKEIIKKRETINE